MTSTVQLPASVPIVPTVALVEQVVAEARQLAERRPGQWSETDALRSMRDFAALTAARRLTRGDRFDLAPQHLAEFRACEVALTAGRSDYFGPVAS